MPYASLLPVLAGLINNSQGQPSINTTGLTNLVNANQQGNTQLINQMPAQVQQLLAQYMAQGNNAANTYQGTTGQIGQNLLNSTQGLYGPNAPAVQASLAAQKQQDYSTLPGTLNALKANLAATGGLQRGGAANAITKATLAPATQFSQQAANTQGQQLQAQQSNVQSALNKIAQMDDATAQSIFGMSTQQATQILQTGNQATQNQLADLINQNNTSTNQNLNIAGIGANQQYQNQVAQNAGQAAIVNGLTNAAGQALGALPGGGGFGGGTPLATGSPIDLSTVQGSSTYQPPTLNLPSPY